MTNRNRVNDIFKERYKQMPSTLYIKNEKIPKENLEKFLSKSHLIFVIVYTSVVQLTR